MVEGFDVAITLERKFSCVEVISMLQENTKKVRSDVSLSCTRMLAMQQELRRKTEDLKEAKTSLLLTKEREQALEKK